MFLSSFRHDTRSYWDIYPLLSGHPDHIFSVDHLLEEEGFLPNKAERNLEKRKLIIINKINIRSLIKTRLRCNKKLEINLNRYIVRM